MTIKSRLISLWRSGKVCIQLWGIQDANGVFHFSVWLLKEGPKVKLRRGEPCVMLAGSSPPLMTSSSTGPLSSVTRQPAAPRTAPPKTPSHREGPGCRLQLHSRAWTKTRVRHGTAPRRCQRNVALQILVRGSRLSCGGLWDSRVAFRNTR